MLSGKVASPPCPGGAGVGFKRRELCKYISQVKTETTEGGDGQLLFPWPIAGNRQRRWGF